MGKGQPIAKQRRSHRRSTRNRSVRAIRRVLSTLVAAIVVEYLVVPQLAGMRQVVHLLGHVGGGWIVAGVLLQAGSLAAYTELTRSLAPHGSLPLPTAARITVATLGTSHVIPGGSVAGTSLGYKLLRDAGLSGSDTGFVLGVQSIGSAVVLNLLLWIGLVITVPLHGFRPLYALAAGFGAALLALLGLGVVGLLRGRNRAAQLACRVTGRIPFVDGSAVGDGLRRVAEQLQAIVDDRRLLARAVGCAASAWLLDAACLWVLLAAFGTRLEPDAVLVAFALANVLAAVPLTPGGLGVVETMLTLVLAAFGAPRGAVIFGVLGYRLIEYWAPIPLGGLAWLSLEAEKAIDRKAGRKALREATATALEKAPQVRDWAKQHGIAATGRAVGR